MTVLVFAYGNLSRGDDALGPMLLQRMQQHPKQQLGGHPIKYLTDYQVQIEHVMDMQGCQRVLLIDASMQGTEPFSFSPILPRQDTHYTTHGMTPATLLNTYTTMFDTPPPQTAMLAIRGYAFELGEQLSEQAVMNLKASFLWVKLLMEDEDFFRWDQIEKIERPI